MKIRRFISGESHAGRVALPVLAFLIPLTITLLIWSMEVWEQRQSIQTQVETGQKFVSRQLGIVVENDSRPLRRMRRQVLGGQLEDGAPFVEAGDAVRREIPSFSAIARVDENHVWMACSAGAAHPMQFVHLDNVPDYAAALAKAKATQQITMLARDNKGEPTITLVIPLIDDVDKEYHGALLGELNFRNTIDEVLDPQTRADFGLSVSSAGVKYETTSPDLAGSEFEVPASITRMFDLPWSVKMRATNAFVASRGGNVTIILWIGIALSLLASYAMFQRIEHRREVNRRTQAHLTALESLNDVSVVIGSRAGQSAQVLNLIVQSASALLEMPMAFISLLEDKNRSIHIVASVGGDKPVRGGHFKVEDSPGVRWCLSTGELLTVDDVDAEGSPYRGEKTVVSGIRAAIVIPLKNDGRIIGTLGLADTKVRSFTSADQSLAQMLGAQASVAVANIRVHQQKDYAIRIQRELMAQRETLFAINVAIFQANTLDESLLQIVERAPAALGVHAALVGLVSENGADLVVAAASGEYAEQLTGASYPIEGCNAEKVFQSRLPLSIENSNDPSLHPELKAILGPGGAMYVPMFRSDGAPLGALVLIRQTPGPFSRDQIEMAQVFADRAGAAVENARLNQQARRDAQTKAMLLRELNHRVKNTLAGISALLSINPPDLSTRARDWLDRHIARIQTIARTHELFVGGLQRVGVQELIEQTLASLSVSKPPTLRIRTEIDGAHFFLQNERAVSLAMVLHELCFNAITHGSADDGELMVRVEHGESDQVSISVMDQGRVPALVEVAVGGDDASDEVLANGDPTAGYLTQLHPLQKSRTGAGLSLVQALVRRELKGLFKFHLRASGGSIATIEFPLLPEETRGEPQ